MPKHRLEDADFRASNKILVWILVFMGYMIALGISANPAGWDAAVFNVVRRIPYTPYSWAGLLFFSVSLYTLGEFTSWRGRGAVIITGSLLCSMWWMGLSLMTARMVYELPNRITVLWPLITFFISVLYASRIVVYATVFTGERWRTNPYQLWGVTFLCLVSLSQMVIGVAPGTILSEVEHPVMFQLAAVNFFGATVTLFGLHLRNQELGIALELAGSFSLVATLIWYCSMVISKQALAGTTLGFGFTQAFTFATLHRSFQILTLKYAQWRGKPHLEERTAQALYAELDPDRHEST